MPVQVRDAVAGDAGALALLWAEMLTAHRSDGVEQPDVTTARAIARAADDPCARIVVAVTDGEVTGCVYLRIASVSPLAEQPVMHLSHLQVDTRRTRQGIGRALVDAAVAWAEQSGVEGIVAAPGANDREANRFLARLGLASVAVLRGATVVAVRSKLPTAPPVAARQSGRNGRMVGHVVAARRSQRRRRGEVVL
ncbi:GNAT family N-acetyltransferase [Nocardioides caldifontis]|uniref:GNAT family N-acetyltransferase n=1 Tax=Nocardioides caldifontis TaxID=2588938 RepID=UPI001EEFF4DB|nr:GNAT family N-acetyltransferase [Nocardioides caldifontis]